MRVGGATLRAIAEHFGVDDPTAAKAVPWRAAGRVPVAPPVLSHRASVRLPWARFESPQMRVGSGGASSMPPQQRNSIEINAPGEWKP